MSRLVLVRSGVRQLLKSDEMAAAMEAQGELVARRAGEGYASEPAHRASSRVIVNVHAATAAAARDNRENNTLLKAMGPPVR